MKKKYFALERVGQNATLNIYGDITSFPWFEGDVSASNLSKQLEEMGDVEQIDVYINSYGGEVAEGLAIYNALRRHKAKVRTVCDGFACSIASVIFMAGDERIMHEASALMIHNAWTWAEGNAAELRKQADDLEKITQLSVEAYKAHSNLEEEVIKELMDKESWILPSEAMEYGFATATEKVESENVNQSAFTKVFEMIKAHQEAKEEVEEEVEVEEKVVEAETEDEEETETDETTEDETDEETEEETEEDEEETANQMWSGFFNALLKM